MKKLSFIFVFCCSLFTFGQTEFAIDKKGINTKSILFASNYQTKEFLKSTSVKWIEKGLLPFTFTEPSIKKDSLISFSATRSDIALRKDKSYYVQFYIQLEASKGRLKFSVDRIDLKQNSRFDMGWQQLDLENPYAFFEKNKGNKKAFLKKISAMLNELLNDLVNHLK